MDTTIIKVRSVNEATDRTVSLPVPTAMTASDMVTGVYASLASLCAPQRKSWPALPSFAVHVIERSLGYESESAFSTAFKRVMGCSPRQYNCGRNPA